MSKTASVSVVIPCYRCAQTIERAVESVAVQSVLPAEVILVDDASGDGTRALLQAISKRYAPGWIKLVLLDQNLGAGSARNAGWATSTQTFIAFLDADDAWHPRKIEVQYGYMTAHPKVAMSGHGFRLLKQGDQPDWPVSLGTEAAQSIGKWEMLLSNRFVTPSVMIKRDVDFRFEARQRYMEDHMLLMRVVCARAQVVKLPLALAAIYKDQFGVKGLSSRLWLMERSDLGNYLRLYREQYINVLQLSALVMYSLLKYARRLMIYVGYLRWKK